MCGKRGRHGLRRGGLPPACEEGRAREDLRFVRSARVVTMSQTAAARIGDAAASFIESKATASVAAAAGALAAAIGSFALSVALKLLWPALPFIDRVGVVFLLALVLALGVSLLSAPQPNKDFIRTDDVAYATAPSFNLGALGVIAILTALYTLFW